MENSQQSNHTATENLGVTGAHTTAGIPHGSTSLTPFLAINNAAAAIVFYQQVFQARLVDATEFGGVVVHAEMDFGQGKLQLGEPNPEYGLVAPPAPPQACYSLAFYCSDVDALLARAVAAGATIREPLATFVTGDRFASIIDPYGVRWSLMSRVQDLSEDECKQNVAQWAKEQAQAAEEQATS